VPCQSEYTSTHIVEELDFDGAVIETGYARAQCKNIEQGVTRLDRVTRSTFGIHPRLLALSIIISTTKGRFLTDLYLNYPESSWRKYVRNFFRTRLRSCHPLAEETSDQTVSFDCFMRSDMQNSRSRRVRVARNS
jgi:hypothetical protein